jgi:hypothetical protein
MVRVMISSGDIDATAIAMAVSHSSMNVSITPAQAFDTAGVRRLPTQSRPLAKVRWWA